ncbi:hypothetical protein [Mycoplasma sp. 'Moose RK']|uniref:hypothetical protein n=1 Tax=Mycoplasma sp. 'Moose RK' TaxID=2780095 RepID=UPI0018C26B8C|nr:hypothetical protein [Mycoplasma sp. 'Moose RK']MBG0730837.1 hypothetical protein [Mycoplasma sp. 'Moose RK']
MNQNWKSNSENKRNTDNFSNLKNINRKKNESKPNGFASRDRGYQYYNNTKKDNYLRDSQPDFSNPFEGKNDFNNNGFNDQEINEYGEINNRKNSVDSQQFVNQDFVENKSVEEEFQVESFSNEPRFSAEKTKTQQAQIWPLNESEIEFFNCLASANSVVQITDLNEKMHYRQKHGDWIASFRNLNNEILLKHEKNSQFGKKNFLERLWNSFSFSAKLVSYSIFYIIISMLMATFWLAFAGFNSFSFWKYSVFTGSLVLFLAIIQFLIYFNNAKNRTKLAKITLFYTMDSIFLLLNYIVLLVFIISPIFSKKLIVANQIAEIIQQNPSLIGTVSEYATILYYVPWFPILTFLFGSLLFIPLKWSLFVKNFWLIFGIFKIISYQKLMKRYRENADESLKRRLNQKWISLYKIGRPLGVSFHPAFIKAFKFLKTNPNPPIEQQQKIVDVIYEAINSDVVNYR